ncbi:MAG: L-aspartate oxidase [bacterium]|nr:L-aspartate oxidase [bacterium]
MTTLFDSRRYLSNFDTGRTGHVFTDVLVIGSGAAGSRAALEAARTADVILITKREPDDAATSWAQGGIAAAMGDGDSPEQHRDDTMAVGGGLNEWDVVELTARSGPAEVAQLLDWGAQFDQAGGGLALTREGGHRTDRVLHGHGDSTGRALIQVLLQRVSAEPRIRVFTHCHVIDLLTDESGCVGAVTYHKKFGHQLVWARSTVLAGGGCGRLYRETTNPEVATGDSVAMAYRAGVTLRDMEMIQFHPTALYIAGSSRALISEAVRGEGAHLVDREGRRFMPDYHPDAELAPRDVVSRAIVTTLTTTLVTGVYLDVRHIPKEKFAQRFPYITNCCAEFGIDVGSDLIPVRPAAHYMIGGIRTDLDARTSLARLYACGECASTGLHGANRLGSNSLIEALVFGQLAGANAAREASTQHAPPRPADLGNTTPPSPKTPLDLADIAQSLRSLMWRNVGIERHGDRLQETLEIIEFWGRFVLDKVFNTPDGWEMQNMLTVGRIVAASAGRRAESCGAHYRLDQPPGPERPAPYHLDVCLSDSGMILKPETVGAHPDAKPEGAS